MVLFLMVATALVTTLTSSISSHKLSRQRTIAEQVARDQIESIRRLPYDQVGLVSGNPPGTVDATETVSVSGLNATVTTQISYVNDPSPLSYTTAANYKRVTVTVTRTSDSKQLARQVTYVAPPARAPYGGINYAIVNAQVVDYALNTPVTDVSVTLGTGPSAPRSDVTDSTGIVTFAALTANPVSGPQAYYDLTLALPSGYDILSDDVPPGASAHVQLAPGQTFDTALRIYKPATIHVYVDDATGGSYGGDATVTVSSSRGLQTFGYTGTPLTITTINGETVVPGLEYTVSAVAGGAAAPSVTQYVPDNYPTDLDSDFTLTLPDVGGVTATVTWGGLPVAGADVTLTGGPQSVSLSATTDASGVATFTGVPSGTGYTVTATKSGQSATASDVTVSFGTTTNVDLALPTGTLTATVTWAGSPASGATVTLTGGPMSISVSGTTSGSGVVTFVNVPAGSGYTVTATKSGQSATATNQTVNAGSTTNVALALPTGTVAVNVKWAGVNVSGATVTLTGGPMSISVSGTTDSNGNVTFINVPAGSGYTVTATKSGQSATATNQTVNAGSTTNVNLALPTGTLVVNVKRNGSNVSGATVTLTLGPMSISRSGTTNSSGNVTFTNVPVGSGYTVKAYKCSVSNPKSNQNTSVTVNSGTTNLSIAFALSTCPL